MIFQNCFHFHEKQELGPVLFNHFIYNIVDMFLISCKLDAKIIRECYTHKNYLLGCENQEIDVEYFLQWF